MTTDMRILKVLLIEDSEKLINIIYQSLDQNCKNPSSADVVASEAGYLDFIQKNRYDLIVSDNDAQGCGSAYALQHARAICPDTPFLCIYETLDEEAMELILRNGAADCIQKDSPSRLSHAIGKALEASALKNKLKAETEKRIDCEQKLINVTDSFINVSHELKTPLSIILIDTDLMEFYLKQSNILNKDKIEKNIAIMRQNAYRLLRLVENLLDVNKIDAGFMNVHMQAVDIVGFIGELTGEVSDYAKNKGIDVTFASDRRSRIVPVDCDKIERVVLNILSNAIKHTKRGGEIRIGLLNTKHSITISVKDNGEGIPDESKSVIFDRFKQADTALTRASDGTGIGLTLSKAFVELLQGRIWFDSKLGEGSTFYVEIPVQQTIGGIQPKQDGMALDKKVRMQLSDII